MVQSHQVQPPGVRHTPGVRFFGGIAAASSHGTGKYNRLQGRERQVGFGAAEVCDDAGPWR